MDKMIKKHEYIKKIKLFNAHKFISGNNYINNDCCVCLEKVNSCLKTSCCKQPLCRVCMTKLEILHCPCCRHCHENGDCPDCDI